MNYVQRTTNKILIFVKGFARIFVASRASVFMLKKVS